MPHPPLDPAGHLVPGVSLELVVGEVERKAARCRILGSGRRLNVSVKDRSPVVPGLVLSFLPARFHRRGKQPWATGEILAQAIPGEWNHLTR